MYSPPSGELLKRLPHLAAGPSGSGDALRRLHTSDAGGGSGLRGLEAAVPAGVHDAAGDVHQRLELEGGELLEDGVVLGAGLDQPGGGVGAVELGLELAAGAAPVVGAAGRR